MDRHRGKSPPFLDREELEKFLHGLLKGQLKRDIPPSAVDELKDLSGLWDFGNTRELIGQPQHRLNRDEHRKLIRNVKAVLIELRSHKEYLNEALPFHGPGPNPSDADTYSSKPRDNHLTKNLPFADPECSLAITYQTLGAIAELPAPGSTKPPDFATLRDGLIVALGAWWRKHVERKPSAVNDDSPFVKLCRYAMTDKTLSYATVNKALKDTRGRGAKFDALNSEAASWEHDPFK